MSTLAYLDCGGGLAGDMLLAALLDAGAPAAALHETPEALGLTGVRIATARVMRGAIACTLVDVDPGDAAGPHRPAAELLGIVEGSALPPAVRDRSLRAIELIARAEADVHDADPAAVTLHELSGVDTLVDICGAFALLDALGVTHLTSSPIPYATGVIATAHGPLPAPGPAVLRILHGAPMVGASSAGEMVTPTGAAVVAVAADAWGTLPPMTLGDVGYGAGHHDPPDRANVLRVVLGTAPSAGPAGTGEVVLLEANLDDMIPELIPDAQERCRAAGALDVWLTPVQMKKGRPGVILSALARPQAERAVAAAMFEHTSTLGIRVSSLRRHELERVVVEVQVQGYAVRVKLGILGGSVVNVAPEHDDCATVAALTGLPVKRIWAEASAAASHEPTARIDGTAG